MAKSENAPTESTSGEFDHLTGADMAVSDIPDRDPLLALGTYEFQYVNHLVYFHPETKSGPQHRIVIMMDPVEAIDVDRSDGPQDDFQDLRQFHVLWIAGRRDFRKIKELVTAFGGDASLPILGAGGTWPALDSCKGQVAVADVRPDRDRRDGSETRALSKFRAA